MKIFVKLKLQEHVYLYSLGIFADFCSKHLVACTYLPFICSVFGLSIKIQTDFFHLHRSQYQISTFNTHKTYELSKYILEGYEDAQNCHDYKTSY